MIADLYVCDRTFLYNGNDTDIEVCRKLDNMDKLIREIRKHKDENKLKVNGENLRNTMIFRDMSINEVIHGNGEKGILREARQLLRFLLSGGMTCSYSFQDMMDTLSGDFEDENNINALVAMNKVNGIPESRQVLYDVDGFYRFRRHYVEKYPSQDPMTFLSDISNYYDHIELNSDRKQLASEMKDVMNRAKDIAHALTALNDDFIKEYNDKEKDGLHDTNHFLDAFAKRHSMDGGSTGRGEHKELYCNFEEKGTLYCGPHLKYKPDEKGRGKNIFRIYFCWDDNSLTKIYVGMICVHV